jgi:pyruvate,water dikinase
MVTTILEKTAIDLKEKSFILWFEEVGTHDVGLVGGKNSSLGEMIQELTAKGVNVPGGFATTAYAYRYFIESAGLEAKLRKLFADLDVDNLPNLQKRAKKARALILNTPFPQNLQDAIAVAYMEMCERYGENTDVAVRSSATAEDLPEASFAGQQETYLNVHGLKSVLESCHKCFASLFTDRAISYRQKKGFDHLAVALSVGVQKMVRSDLATSGVMFSIDTETGFKNAALITAAYGLGENVVQGAVNPDEYFVFKPTLKTGFKPILEKRLGSKSIKMIYDTGGNKLTKNVEVAKHDQEKYCINDEEILQLARWACIIEDHYSRVRGMDTPMDIEWAKDGLTGGLFIVQARPETVQSQKSANIIKTYELKEHSTVLARGRSVGAAIGQGKAQVIRSVSQINQFRPGEVLITNRTDPDWEPIMKQASAIVTNQGGRTCHAAIIAREMGIPAIVGCNDATEKISTGQDVTISCSEGDEGHVFTGLLPYEVHETALDNLPRTKTQILMNVGNPEQAFGFASYPADGVGLARLEFIIANHIKAHPLALMKFDELEDQDAKAEIAELTKLYEGDRAQFFVDKLARGVAMIAAAFYPKPVVVRMSDFKTNEYANLLGGRQFEPKEENPMIGQGERILCEQNLKEIVIVPTST